MQYIEKKGAIGSLAGLITSVSLQPMENIKMVLLVPPKDLQLSNNFFRNVVTVTKYLHNDEGAKAFYRGLVPNVLRTVFSSFFFFSFLRLCEATGDKHYQTQNPHIIPFLSSLTARVVSCFISNPLSVIETRFEYGGHERWHGGVVSSLRKIYAEEGVRGFWKGGLATTYKEGLFAGGYYTLYLKGKDLGLNAFVSGMLAGMISTSFTHPFEIVRAEIQSYVLTHNEAAATSIGKQVKVLFETGEAFRGLAPRVIKKPLSNTLSFVLFQMFESLSGHHE